MLITKYWHAHTSSPSFFYFGSQHREYNQIPFYICEPEKHYPKKKKIPLFFKIISSNGALLNLDLEVIDKVECNDKTFWPRFRFIWTETKKWNIAAPNLKDCRKHSLGGTLTSSASGTFNWSADYNRHKSPFLLLKSDKITRKPLTKTSHSWSYSKEIFGMLKKRALPLWIPEQGGNNGPPRAVLRYTGTQLLIGRRGQTVARNHPIKRKLNIDRGFSLGSLEVKI